MRATCLLHGRSLDHAGTDLFPWADLVAILATVRPGDILYSAMYPEHDMWDHKSMLLADIADSLRVIVWQGGKRRKADFPRPIPRPGVEDKHERRFGGTAVEIDEMQAFLDRKRAGLPTAA